jgi:hypothetical protein
MPGHADRASDDTERCPARARIEVAPGLRGEHLEQAVEIAAGSGSDELLGDLPVLMKSPAAMAALSLAVVCGYAVAATVAVCIAAKRGVQ